MIKALQRVFALLLAVIGLALALGGARLLLLGGSAYYVVTGLLLAASAILLWRGQKSGLYLYGAILIGTLAWAIWEAGFDAWALMPRLGLLLALGAWLLLPLARRGLTPRAVDPLPARRARGAPLLLIGSAALAVVAGGALHRADSTLQADPIYQAGTRPARSAADTPSASRADTGEWLHYGGNPGGTRFSPATQITTANVRELQVAWTYRTGPSPPGYVTFEATPLKVGNALYLCTGYNDVIALDADSGRELWRHRTQVNRADVFAFTCRGVGYYRVPGATGACAERIYTNTVDARLIALDAHDGAPCVDFGDHGEVSLLTGMGEVIRGYYYVTSAPTVVHGRIVLGGWVTDGQYWGEPSGVIRAFDAATGRLAWAFDMGRPDRQGEPPPGEQYTRATPNSWAPMSADEELGLVYAPTGNATPDYYGAQRRSFDDQYSSSVVALDAQTGRVRWSFQTVHHDIWDYDVASQPTLVDLPTAQGVRKALLQPTKRGEVFVLDRTTGEPIMPVEERPVPQSGAAASERLSKTQPYSVGMPSFRGPDLTERSMWGLTPLDQLWCRIRFREARYGGPLTPIGQQWTLMFPGFFGGHNWGGVTVDPDRHIMVATSNRMANYDRLLTREEVAARGLKARRPGSTEFVGGAVPQENTPYGADVHVFFSPLEVPCQQPPYGFLSAVDLLTGELVWHQPLGTTQDIGPLGMRLGLKLPFGPPSAGGAITTGSGLTFVAASQDAYLRAFDTGSGRLLWEGRLPAGGQATPMTYTSASGRQMVVIAAGGMGSFKTRMGDYVVAFALPGTPR
ncbi:MAG: membrane-bound PQQ-dependent dehydrogenase, glucose/quinate/shikimate family [Gammaproteobacteria bacterium]|nr:membrane-bound PQQ-dependent dehydrogenase, glucose/quinate/shikimate family [Gammaproteobacteria bacterium]